MVELRPLILVTGTIHAEGGRVHKVESSSGSRFVQNRNITKDRRSADVISTTYMRRLRQLRILKTPFGTLVDPAKLGEVKTMINEATSAVAEFNRHESAACVLENCMLWEPLKGARLAAVQGWIARKLMEKDSEVKAAEEQLTLARSDRRPGHAEDGEHVESDR